MSIGMGTHTHNNNSNNNNSNNNNNNNNNNMVSSLLCAHTLHEADDSLSHMVHMYECFSVRIDSSSSKEAALGETKKQREQCFEMQ